MPLRTVGVPDGDDLQQLDALQAGRQGRGHVPLAEESADAGRVDGRGRELSGTRRHRALPGQLDLRPRQRLPDLLVREAHRDAHRHRRRTSRRARVVHRRRAAGLDVEPHGRGLHGDRRCVWRSQRGDDLALRPPRANGLLQLFRRLQSLRRVRRTLCRHRRPQSRRRSRSHHRRRRRLQRHGPVSHADGGARRRPHGRSLRTADGGTLRRADGSTLRRTDGGSRRGRSVGGPDRDARNRPARVVVEEEELERAQFRRYRRYRHRRRRRLSLLHLSHLLLCPPQPRRRR
mmetsp:Transcript_5692/g.14702  ORF Transcript_5692/g.14702 Transcript_5692/m.14702 type:complete len:289 (-) Transcript_5692:382-1248(-)